MRNKIRQSKSATVRVLGTVGVLLLAGCAPQPETTPSNAENTMATSIPTTETPTGAIAVLHPTKGSNVRGTVTFTKEAGGIRVKADLSGLAPGPHGFHIHENGDCSAPDASSAGGHFNPTAMAHGAPDKMPHHVGDFGNITADKSGKASYDKVYSDLALDGASSVIGRAVIVHAQADDLRSQPSGDAGGRQSCGVIGVQ